MDILTEWFRELLSPNLSHFLYSYLFLNVICLAILCGPSSSGFKKQPTALLCIICIAVILLVLYQKYGYLSMTVLIAYLIILLLFWVTVSGYERWKIVICNAFFVLTFVVALYSMYALYVISPVVFYVVASIMVVMFTLDYIVTNLIRNRCATLQNILLSLKGERDDWIYLREKGLYYFSKPDREILSCSVRSCLLYFSPPIAVSVYIISIFDTIREYRKYNKINILNKYQLSFAYLDLALKR